MVPKKRPPFRAASFLGCVFAAMKFLFLDYGKSLDA